MLFDIRGRRRRFIQVIYVFLALLLGGGLVLFGIGGDAQGGLGAIFGLDQNSGGTGNPDYDNQIESAQERLEVDPEDQAALLQLARFQFLAGNDATETDDQGRVAFTEEAEDRFQQATDAWERYLATDPRSPDDSAASLIFQAYSRLASTSELPDPQVLEGAQKTAAIIAEERPSVNSFLQLAAYSYFSGEVKAGDAAAEKAIAEAGDDVDEDALKSLKSQLKQIKQTGKALQAQIDATRPGEEDLENPLGGLGSTPGDPGAFDPNSVNGGGLPGGGG